MERQQLAEEGLEAITNIDFPRQLGIDEVDRFMKYLVVELCWPGSSYEIQLNEGNSRLFGNKYEGKRPRTINEVDVSLRGAEKSGIISGPGSISARFRLIEDRFGDDEQLAYRGIRFQVTPGYSPGELTSDSEVIMRHVATSTRQYFKKYLKLS
jgi:hypothetical protein